MKQEEYEAKLQRGLIVKMLKNIGRLAEHINSLFNVDTPELVDAGGLTGDDVRKLKKEIQEKYPGRYRTGVSVEIINGRDMYALSVRRED